MEEGSTTGPRMIDVSGKDITVRTARARAAISLSDETVAAIREGRTKKGDVIATAKVAAVMAVKRTPELIPLCHPVRVDGIDVDIDDTGSGLVVEVAVSGRDRTGFEMEALTGATAAALTIYDMIKSIEPAAVISDVRLVAKTGGRSGDFQAD